MPRPIKDYLSSMTKEQKWVLAYCLFGFVFNLLSFYPGVMAGDSYWQYIQARDFNINNAHPAIMQLVWAFFLLFSKGATGIFIFHLAMIWLAIYFLYDYFKHSGWRFFLLLIPFLPPVVYLSSMILKDVALVSSLFLATSLIIRQFYKNTIGFIIILLLLFYASTVRHNGFFATAPIIFLLAFLKYEKKSFSIKTLSALAIIIVIKSISLAIVASPLVKEKGKWDIGGIVDYGVLYFAMATNRPYVDVLPMEVIRKFSLMYFSGTNIVCHCNRWPEDKKTAIRFDSFHISQKLNLQASQQEKITLWFNHPWLAIKLLSQSFAYLLRSPSIPPASYISHFGPHKFPITADIAYPTVPEYLRGFLSMEEENNNFIKPAWLKHFRYEIVENNINIFYYKPYFYLLMLINIFIASFFITNNKYRRHLVLLRTIAGSGIIYIGHYGLLMYQNDFRFIYWSVFAFVLSLSLLFAVPWAKELIKSKTWLKQKNLSLLGLMIINSIVWGNFGNITWGKPENFLIKQIDNVVSLDNKLVTRTFETTKQGEYKINRGDAGFNLYRFAVAQKPEVLAFDYQCLPFHGYQNQNFIITIDNKNIYDPKQKKLIADKTNNEIFPRDLNGVVMIDLTYIDNYKKLSSISQLAISVPRGGWPRGACKKMKIENVRLGNWQK